MVPILLEHCAVTFIPLNEASHHKVLSAKQESYLLGLISNQTILPKVHFLVSLTFGLTCKNVACISSLSLN